MTEPRAVLERALGRVDPRAYTFETFRSRRDRRHRNQRFAAGALGLAVAIAATVFVVRAFAERTSEPDAGAGPNPVAEGFVRFRSAFHGYSIDHPDDWTVRPALLPWRSGFLTSGLMDRLVDPDSAERIVLEVASIELPEDMTAEEWLDREEGRQAYALGLDTCEQEHAVAPTEVDGLPGRIAVDCGLVTVVTEGRGYVIRLHGDIAVRPELRAALTSIQLHPEEG